MLSPQEKDRTNILDPTFIVHNWITDQYPREYPTEELPESLSGETTTLEETTNRNIEYTRLIQAIRKLTPNQQQVIVLKFCQDCENMEIARSLGKPVSLLVAGPVSDATSLQTWFWSASILNFAIAIAGFFVPALIWIEENHHSNAVEMEPLAAKKY
jgi:hypothetical protein